MGIGLLAATSAAACWATSSIIYGRTRLSAWTINFAKNIFGTSFVLVHLVVLWVVLGQTFLGFSGTAWFYLVTSGLIGIALGDTCYFRSLQILGPRRSLVVATSAPVFGAITGWSLLGETLSWWEMTGIMLCIYGITVVVMDKQARKEAPGHFPGSEIRGVVMGLIAAFCQATGGAISKIGMQECTPLEATFVRILAASLFGVVFVFVTGRHILTAGHLRKKDNLRRLLPAAALGSWMGIWFSQIGFHYADVAIAAMLMSTGPLFAIPLVWCFDGHRISLRSILGTLIAIGGIAIALIIGR